MMFFRRLLGVSICVLCVCAVLLFPTAVAAPPDEDEVVEPVDVPPDEDDTVPVIEATEVAEGGDTTINVTVNMPQLPEQEEAAGVDPEPEPESDMDLVAPAMDDSLMAAVGDVLSVFDLDEPPDASTDFLSIIEDVFGTYTPRTYTVDVYMDDGTVVTSTQAVPGLAGVDWDWILGAAVFLICFYSFFRVLGLVISRA